LFATIAKESGLEKVTPVSIGMSTASIQTISSSGEAWLAAIAVNVGMTMNKNYSRNYVMEGLRGVGRPYKLEHLSLFTKPGEETSTIYVALIDSREPEPQTTFHCSTRRAFPSNGSRPPREPGKLCIDVCEIEERYMKRSNASLSCAKSFGGEFRMKHRIRLDQWKQGCGWFRPLVEMGREKARADLAVSVPEGRSIHCGAPPKASFL